MKKLFALVLALMLFAVPAMAAEYTFNPEKPYDGVLMGQFDEIEIGTETDKGIATYYLPEGIQPWAPAVIVLTPDNVTAKAFAEGEVGAQWKAVADAEKIGVAFLEPQDGKSWNLTLDAEGRCDADVVNELYFTMRSKSVELKAPFSMDKTHTALVGYGEGGAAALLAGARYATDFSSVVAVEAPALTKEVFDTVGEELVIPFPADSRKGIVEMNVQAKTVDMPVWMIRSETEAALDFFVNAAEAKETEPSEWAEKAYVAENEAVRIWTTEKEQSPAQIWEAFSSKTNRFMAMQDGGRVAFTTDFSMDQFTLNEEEINGEIRRWVTYVPSTYDASKETPLVLAIHGYTATAQSTVEESRWHELAEENGFIVIFPQGLVREAPAMGNIPASCWIAGAFASMFDIDPMVDVNFINAILDRAEKDYNIDKTRIYATGHSNGSMMTWELGVRQTGRFAAIAPIGSMSLPTTEFSSDMLLPTWSFMGEYDGAGMELVEGSANVNVLSAWNAHNGTDESKVVSTEEFDGQWKTVTFSNADNVPLVKFTGILRTPHIYMPEESEMIWNEFFTKYTRGEDGTLYYEGEPVKASEYVQSSEWYEKAPAEEAAK